MENKIRSGSQNSSGAVLGALLILAGILFLVFRYAPVDVGQYGWPAFVVLAGAGLTVTGLLVRPAVGLVVPGSIVTMVGLILAVQNTFGLWATWSYAWPLVFPGAVGLGIALMGVSRGDRQQARQGSWMALLGVGLFVVFATFFEGLLGISGIAVGPVFSIAAPLFLIALGIVLLVGAALHRQRP